MTMVLIAAMAVSKYSCQVLALAGAEKADRSGRRSLTFASLPSAQTGFGTQDYISGGVIAALVVLNVAVGTINEYKAEKVSSLPGYPGFDKADMQMASDCRGS